MVSPRGIEPRSRALQAPAMTTSAKATCTWQGVWVTIPVTYFQRVVSAPIDLPPTENGQTLRIRSVPYAFTERNASTTPNAALKSW